MRDNNGGQDTSLSLQPHMPREGKNVKTEFPVVQRMAHLNLACLRNWLILLFWSDAKIEEYFGERNKNILKTHPFWMISTWLSWTDCQDNLSSTWPFRFCSGEISNQTKSVLLTAVHPLLFLSTLSIIIGFPKELSSAQCVHNVL